MEQKNLTSIFKSILYDEYTFVQFISEQGFFSHIDSNIYITGLNNYMSLILLFNTTGISKIVFDRINSINIKYNYNLYYNYNTCIAYNKYTLSASFIEQILNDENLLAMFLDFHNHPYIFWNIPLESCLSQITFYLKSASEKNITLNPKMFQHFEQITQKYSSYFKQRNELKGELPVGEIDQELEKRVLSTIDFSKSRFSIALQLYIALCKELNYNATFLTLNQDLNNPIAKKIYSEEIKNINLEQNYVTCKQFSNIYAKLLIKCNYDARVNGDFHKFVTFKCDDKIIEADSSKQLLGSQGFYLCDFTRCKLNLPVAGFIYKNDNLDISSDLQKAYQELKPHPAFMLETIELLNKGVNKESFLKKINILGEKSKKSKLKTVDYIGYLVSIIKTIFTPKELNEINLYTTYIKNKNNYQIGALIIKDNQENQESQIFLFYNDFGYIKITEEQARNLLTNRNIVIRRNDERIKKLLNNPELVDDSFKNKVI